MCAPCANSANLSQVNGLITEDELRQYFLYLKNVKSHIIKRGLTPELSRRAANAETTQVLHDGHVNSRSARMAFRRRRGRRFTRFLFSSSIHAVCVRLQRRIWLSLRLL